RAPLTDRSEYLLEIVRRSYLPRPNSQHQRTRRGWKNVFELAYTGRNGRVVENRNTGKFGNGFFEQLQPLPAQLSGKVCKAGDVAAGTGKAFNQACLDRIGPSAGHNDGNRLGRILGRLDWRTPSCYHD